MGALNGLSLTLIQDSIFRLQRISPGTDAPSAFRYLLPTEGTQVFFPMPRFRTAGTPAGQYSTGLLFAIPYVQVSCIVGSLQDTVVPAFLLEKDRSAAMLWMKRSHNEGIIHMALGNVHSDYFRSLATDLSQRQA